MRRLKATFGYTGAALTVVAALATPMFLMNVFARGVAATGVRVDPTYTGGEPARVSERGGYSITVNRPVVPAAPLSRVPRFVQLSWSPAAALPPEVSDEVDLDGDGAPDCRVRFAVPRDARARLRVDVEPLGPAVRPLRGVTQEGYGALIARVGAAIVVRVPLAAGR
jgi:hypothetical protein